MSGANGNKPSEATWPGTKQLAAVESPVLLAGFAWLLDSGRHATRDQGFISGLTPCPLPPSLTPCHLASRDLLGDWRERSYHDVCVCLCVIFCIYALLFCHAVLSRILQIVCSCNSINCNPWCTAQHGNTRRRCETEGLTRLFR